MTRTFLRSKIHRATVTQADLDYEGSITIDRDLIDAAGMHPYEKVEIYDVTNGNRLETYVIEGEAGAGQIGINGAAAHLVRPGDKVIIACYGQFDETEIARHEPKLVFVDEKNRIRELKKAELAFTVSV